MDRLALVVPCYNEEAVIQISSEALRGVLSDLIQKNKIAEDSFVLFVDDGSKDKTWELIEQEHKQYDSVKGLKLAGNVGHQFALTAGLIVAKDISDVTVSIDADLQDDVNVIEEMIDKFHDGNDIVYGVRKDEEGYAHNWSKENKISRLHKWQYNACQFHSEEFQKCRQAISKHYINRLQFYGLQTNCFLIYWITVVITEALSRLRHHK